MRQTILFITLLAVAAVAAACGSASNTGTTPPAGKPVASGPAANNLTATISNADGVMKKGNQEFTLTFADASGKSVDVGSAALNFRMAAMGSMSEMNTGATFTTTGTPGVYKGKADLEMGGEWKAMITYEGPAGKGSFSMPVVVK
jgi:ABC-type phosphate transport system substrate-binding protein